MKVYGYWDSVFTFCEMYCIWGSQDSGKGHVTIDEVIRQRVPGTSLVQASRLPRVLALSL